MQQGPCFLWPGLGSLPRALSHNFFFFKKIYTINKHNNFIFIPQSSAFEFETNAKLILAQFYSNSDITLMNLLNHTQKAKKGRKTDFTHSLEKPTWGHIHVDRVFEKSCPVLSNSTIKFSLDRRKVLIVVRSDFALSFGVDQNERCYVLWACDSTRPYHTLLNNLLKMRTTKYFGLA